MTASAPAAAPPSVLHINSLLNGGGTDDQCVKLAAGLRELGQRAELAGPDGRAYQKVARELGIPYHPVRAKGPLKMGFILGAARVLRDGRFDIVHGHQGRDLWATVLAARLSGVLPRIVITRHLAKSPGSWLSRRFLLNRCDVFVAVSHFVARVLREGVYEPDSPEPERRSRPPMAGDHTRVRVIYGGIDTNRFRPMGAEEMRKSWGLASGDYAFGVVGSYDPPRGKGQREFLQAAARVQAEIPQARFLIVGRGGLEPTLQEDIAKLGLTGKAWLTPWCQDMPAAMNGLDCLVHPQIGTEAFGAVVLEAFACGKPVIASDLDGIPEAFAGGNYGQLVAPESVEQLADALRHWARQPALGETARQALHQRIVERFSLGIAAGRMLDIYRTLA